MVLLAAWEYSDLSTRGEREVDGVRSESYSRDGRVIKHDDFRVSGSIRWERLSLPKTRLFGDKYVTEAFEPSTRIAEWRLSIKGNDANSTESVHDFDRTYSRPIR